MSKPLLLSLALFGTATASWEKIAGYQPGSKVTSHNAVDLDMDAIYNELGESSPDYTQAKAIYLSGGNSKPYALMTIDALSGSVAKGDAVSGTGLDGTTVVGKMYSSYVSGVTEIKVAYPISSVQAAYTGCKMGSLTVKANSVPADPNVFTTSCYAATGTISIVSKNNAGVVTQTLTQTYSAVMNKAGRTLNGFSTSALGKMHTRGTNGGCAGDKDRATDGCPYVDFTEYYNYYGDGDYASKLVLAALDGTPTNFANSAGDMDFTNQVDSLRKEVIKKGAAYMSAHMYAIREFEDAIDDCKAGCHILQGETCNSFSTDSVHAWDEGVAFYTGSLEGAATGGNSAGVMSYRVAEKRCGNYKTCGANADSTSGQSYTNIEMFKALDLGQNKLLLGKCDEARPYVRRVVAMMGIPLIQGTLRYAYKLDKLGGGDKERGEGAVFAAAIVPRVHACDGTGQADAKIIMDNMKVGATSTDHAAVKAAFERNYACMEVKCEEIGGLWFSSGESYYAGAEPCPRSVPLPTTTVEEEVVPTWGIAIIAAVGGLCVLTGLGFAVVIMKERAGTPMFVRFDNKGSGTAV